MIEAKKIRFDSEHLHVELVDGRIISTPLKWYPVLMNSSDEQQSNFELIARNTMIEWADLDLHIGHRRNDESGLRR